MHHNNILYEYEYEQVVGKKKIKTLNGVLEKTSVIKIM